MIDGWGTMLSKNGVGSKREEENSCDVEGCANDNEDPNIT